MTTFIPAIAQQTHPSNSLYGQKYGRLTPFEPDILGGHIKDPHTYWRCQCECGAVATVRRDKLISGHTKSCGCLTRKPSIKPDKLHTVQSVSARSLLAERRVALAVAWGDFYAGKGPQPSATAIPRAVTQAKPNPKLTEAQATKKAQDAKERYRIAALAKVLDNRKVALAVAWGLFYEGRGPKPRSKKVRPARVMPKLSKETLAWADFYAGRGPKPRTPTPTPTPTKATP